MQSPSHTPDAVAYVDEAGAFGRTNRLRPEHDEHLGIFAAVVLRRHVLATATRAFAPPFERFKAAAPAGTRLHITDAYTPGNEEWARVADIVREDAYAVVRELKIPVVFEAQRLGEPRGIRDILAGIHTKVAEGRRSGVEVKPPASKEHVEEALLEMLFEKFELYAQDFDISAIEVRFDDVDGGLFKRYERKLEELRAIGDTREEVVGYERATGMLHRTTLRTCFPSLVVRRIAKLAVAGKDEPLVLLTDIVANSLYDYFRRLDAAAPLDEIRVRGWTLAPLVWPTP